jgi:hypothetical protein
MESLSLGVTLLNASAGLASLALSLLPPFRHFCSPRAVQAGRYNVGSDAQRRCIGFYDRRESLWKMSACFETH